MATKITTDHIGPARVAIEIFVDSSGQFSAEYNDERYSANTRADLLVLLEKAVKQAAAEKAAPVTIVNLVYPEKKSHWENPVEEGRGVIHAQLRGKHGREHSMWLFTSESGVKFKLGGYGDRLSQLCRRLTPEEVADYATLVAAIDTAQAAFDAWLQARHVSPQEALKIEE